MESPGFAPRMNGFAGQSGLMRIGIDRRPLEQVDAEALVMVVFEGKKEERFGAATLFESGEVEGKPLELTVIHHPTGVAAQRVLLAGAGKPEKFATLELRKLMAASARHLKSKSIRRVVLALEGSFAAPAWVCVAVEGIILGNYEPDRYKTDNNKKSIESFAVVTPGNGAAGLEEAAERGRIVAEAQNFTLDLVNEPPNRLTPAKAAEIARQMAADYGLACDILEPRAMEALGMGALLGVAQGSAEPPALIVVRYRPAQPRGGAHLGLIGKGVTFDSGGISIKPAEGMEKMKYDMAGGASMLGAMRALAQLKPAIPVTGFMPCVENMLGSRAQRPGDVVTAMSGKTIEVINTDAEGRLILADTLTYARRQGCTHLVDAATLTGSIRVALGHLNVGLFSSDAGLRDRVLAAANAVGERMWPMPLDDEYKEVYLKSAFADLPNVGGPAGGAITGAMFLKEFAEDTPWVHLDIAGTAWIDEAKPFTAKGSSGVPVRTLVRLAMDWNE